MLTAVPILTDITSALSTTETTIVSILSSSLRYSPVRYLSDLFFNEDSVLFLKLAFII